MQIANDKIVKISWGALAGVLGIVVAFSAWMTSIDSKAADAKEQIVSLKTDSKHVETILQTIDRRLQRIEILLEEFVPNKKQGD